MPALAGRGRAGGRGADPVDPMDGKR